MRSPTDWLNSWPFLLTLILFISIQAISQKNPRSGKVTIGEFTLGYHIEGKGTPTLVIGNTLYYPRTFSQELRDHLELIFIDHRGFIPSPGPMPKSTYELDTILNDVDIIREYLGYEKVAVLGHSGHSFMALEYGKKYPDHVSHVVMIGTAPNFGEENTQLLNQYWEESVDPNRKKQLEMNVAAMPDEKLAELPADQAFIKGYIRNGPMIWYDYEYDSSPLWEGVSSNMDMVDYVWGELFAKIDVTEGIEQLKAPVFLALGRYDFLVAPPSSWNEVRSEFKDLTIRVFERSGHTPQMEEAEFFDHELLSWLEIK